MPSSEFDLVLFFDIIRCVRYVLISPISDNGVLPSIDEWCWSPLSRSQSLVKPLTSLCCKALSPQRFWGHWICRTPGQCTASGWSSRQEKQEELHSLCPQKGLRDYNKRTGSQLNRACQERQQFQMGGGHHQLHSCKWLLCTVQCHSKSDELQKGSQTSSVCRWLLINFHSTDTGRVHSLQRLRNSQDFDQWDQQACFPWKYNLDHWGWSVCNRRRHSCYPFLCVETKVWEGELTGPIQVKPVFRSSTSFCRHTILHTMSAEKLANWARRQCCCSYLLWLANYLWRISIFSIASYTPIFHLHARPSRYLCSAPTQMS